MCKQCGKTYAAGESRFLQSGVGYVCSKCFFGYELPVTPIEPLAVFAA